CRSEDGDDDGGHAGEPDPDEPVGPAAEGSDAADEQDEHRGRADAGHPTHPGGRTAGAQRCEGGPDHDARADDRWDEFGIHDCPLCFGLFVLSADPASAAAVPASADSASADSASAGSEMSEAAASTSFAESLTTMTPCPVSAEKPRKDR